MNIYKPTDEAISQAPEYSPGLVENNETLLRTIFSPENFKNGNIGPSAFPIKHLNQKGLSLDREKYTSLDLIQKRALQMQSNSPEHRQFAFVLALYCKQIRDINYQGQQALVVIDDATKQNPAHASAHANTDICLSESEWRKIRDCLIQIVESYTKLENVP